MRVSFAFRRRDGPKGVFGSPQFGILDHEGSLGHVPSQCDFARPFIYSEPASRSKRHGVARRSETLTAPDIKSPMRTISPSAANSRGVFMDPAARSTISPS